MKRSPVRLASRAAAAALVTLLAACDGEGIIAPRTMAGHWLAVEATASDAQSYRTEEWLQLGADGEYRWITIRFGPVPGAVDGMLHWTTRDGDWGVDGEMLALRTITGSWWQPSPSGGSWGIMDYSGEWHRGHRVRREGDRLIVEEEPGPTAPEERLPVPRTLVFERVSSIDRAPRPPGAR